MPSVENKIVSAAEAGLRFDRWFARHYPEVPFGHLQKLLRTGQIRVDGKRVKAGVRLAARQSIRIPPLQSAVKARAGREGSAAPPRDPLTQISKAEARALERAVIYKDDEIIALNKPAGLAVQGGSNTTWHLDLLLDLFRYGSSERPRLVHRLDRDTSGVLLIGRTVEAAAWLTKSFRKHENEKVYWAVVQGRAAQESGSITLSLSKRPSEGGEKVVPDVHGQKAVTHYKVLEHAGKELSLIALKPTTGRTHQLRAHCKALGTPILGDGKYGGKAAFHANREIERRVHLHARALKLVTPAGEQLTFIAPPPDHMKKTCQVFGLTLPERADPFAPFRQSSRR